MSYFLLIYTKIYLIHKKSKKKFFVFKTQYSDSEVTENGLPNPNIFIYLFIRISVRN